MNLHMGDKYLHIIFLFKEVYPYTSFPASLSPIIQSCFFPSPSSHIWPHELGRLIPLAIFPTKQNEQPGSPRVILLTGSTALHSPSGLARGPLQGSGWRLRGGACTADGAFRKPGACFLSPVN